MFAKMKIGLSAAILLAAASAAPTKGDSLPKIDLEKVCRASEKEINAVFTGINRDVFAACMNDEQAARDQLVKNWATFSTLDRARCVVPMDYLPSYVEWSTCIEMTRDVRKMRKEQAGATPAASTPAASNVNPKSHKGQIGSKTKECPVVQWREDGSVVSANAC
jgi:hypothetical protein